jgi:hypothetical protein
MFWPQQHRLHMLVILGNLQLYLQLSGLDNGERDEYSFALQDIT